MHFLFLFLDGVGLGPDDPKINPLARAEMPNLTSLLDGQRLVRDSLHSNVKMLVTKQATLLALDVSLGVEGRPQSASGQAAILTGINIPKSIGHHYGPKPNQAIRHLLQGETIFHHLKKRGYEAALLNAYPQGYFERIESGRRLPGAVAMAVKYAGIHLKDTKDLQNGDALSADFTGNGWRDHLNIPEVPVYSTLDAGSRLAKLAQKHDFSFFEYWLSDYAGHRGDMQQSCSLLEEFDQVLGGLVAAWDSIEGLIFITSDHGNIEDTRSRRHTCNQVPGLVIGPPSLRKKFSYELSDLTGISPAIMKLFD